MTPRRRVVGILISGAKGIAALAPQGQKRMLDLLPITAILHGLRPIRRAVMALIKGAQGQPTGVAADLPAIKIYLYRARGIEREGFWGSTLGHLSEAPKGYARCC